MMRRPVISREGSQPAGTDSGSSPLGSAAALSSVFLPPCSLLCFCVFFLSFCFFFFSAVHLKVLIFNINTKRRSTERAEPADSWLVHWSQRETWMQWDGPSVLQCSPPQSSHPDACSAALRPLLVTQGTDCSSSRLQLKNKHTSSPSETKGGSTGRAQLLVSCLLSANTLQ